jgi:hypothetical protein
MASEFFKQSTLLESRGRREGRVLAAPMVRAQKKSTRQNHRYEPEQPAFPAQWCYGLYVLSPVRPGFVVTVALHHLARRGTCIGAPGPHAFAVRIMLFV